MSSIFWVLFWAVLAFLLVAAGVRIRGRVRRRLGSEGPVVDDDAIRRIVRDGTLVTDEDEPLDLTDIEEEERRFWEEEWDEADEW